MFRLRGAIPTKLAGGAASGMSAFQSASFSTTIPRLSNKDYYKTLGISKTATKDEVKKAYRKRAMETHPDQGGKKEEFAEVSEAYECLSNAERRQVYDQYGSEAANQAASGMGGMGGMGGFGGRDPRDVFSEFFRGFGGGGGDFGGDSGPRQAAPVEVSVRLTLEEIAAGCSKTVRATKAAICKDCRGHGTKSQEAKPKCSQCQGTGHVMQQRHMGGGMMQQLVSDCPRCQGSGSVAKKDDECPRCTGAGFRNLASETNVQIPAGVPSAATMILRGEGGQMPNAIAGDMHITITQSPHAVFTRRGNDLTTTMNISLSESLLGLQRPLKLVSGRTVCVQSNPEDGILKQNSVIRLPGEGIPKDNGGKGDVFVYINVDMPKTPLTQEQKEAVIKAFGEPKPDPNATPGNTIKAKLLKESKEKLEEQKASAWSGDGGSGGGNGGGRSRRGAGGHPGAGGQQQMECAQQ